MQKKPKVLIIDDETAVEKAMKKALKNEGYALSFAANGKEGLEQMRKEVPDLIFLDLKMPVMGGIEFLDTIAIKPDDPYLVVVITGHGDDREVEDSFKRGVNFFLRKPLSMVEVTCLARRCIQVKATEAELRRHRDQLEELVEERTEALRDQLFFQQQLIDSMPFPLFYKDRDGVYLGCNNLFAEAMGETREAIVNKTDKDLDRRGMARELQRRDKNVLRGRVNAYESRMIFEDGVRHDVMVYKSAFSDSRGEVAGMVGALLDISDRKQYEEDIASRTAELEDANMALRVLLKQVNTTRTEMEEKVLSNIKDLVLPYLDYLDEMVTGEKPVFFLQTLRANLTKVTSVFSKRLSSRYIGLSPREIQIANLVRLGKTNKDSARMLNITKNAVEFHRNNLRRKLGLKNKKVNLRSYLLSLEKSK